MTIEEKARAYDEALNDMRAIYQNTKGDAKLAIEHAFPELAESEDERIRKEIINFLRSPFVNENITDEKVAPWIAWLERQKYPNEDYLNNPAFLDGFDTGREVQKIFDEQKPITESKRLANKVIEYLTKCGYSPVLKDDSKKEHFHIDIPRHEDDFWHSEEYKHCRSVLGEYYMEGDYGGDTYTLYVWREKKEQKPASTEDMPYITDEHFYEREPKDSFRYKLAKYMAKNCRKEESPDGYTYHISAETILEMAKEELLKRGVVQKPNIEICPHSIKSKSYKENGYPIENCDYGLEIAENILKKTLGKIEGYQSDDGMREHQTAIEAVRKANEQKPVEWSKEDEQNLNVCLSYIKDEPLRNWLKDAIIRCGKPAEWSEEDKQMIERLIRHTQEEFNELCNDRYGHQEIISDLKESCRERMNWLEKLKSLRPQPHTVSIKNATKFGNLEYERGVKDGIQYSENHRWKPSEEQMSMLRAIVNDPNNVGAESCHLAMQSLYNDLLKLKGGVAPMREIDE